MGRFDEILTGSVSIGVAAADAPLNIRASADYVCDGVNDEVQIQAALDASINVAGRGGSVTLSAGKFYIGASINMYTGMHLYGQGVHATWLELSANTDMFVLDDLTPTAITNRVGTFLTIKNMYIYGDSSNQTTSTNTGIKSLSNIKDFHLSDVFVSRFAGRGMDMRGTWGHNLINVVIEYCSSDGYRTTMEDEMLVTGTSSGVFEIGDAVTQAVSGATGFVTDSKTLDSGVSLYVSQRAGTFDGTNVINADSTASAFTTSSIANNTTIGAKATVCKIQQNEANQYVIGRNVSHTTMTNCEFKAVSGFYAIVLDQCSRSQIIANRFTEIVSGSLGYIGIGADDSQTSHNLISGNMFNCLVNGTPCVDIDTDNSLGNVITGNMAKGGTGVTDIIIVQVGLNAGANDSYRYSRFVNSNNYASKSDGSFIQQEDRPVHYRGGAVAAYTPSGATFDNADPDWADTESLTLMPALQGNEIEFHGAHATNKMRIEPNGAEQIEKTVGGGLEAADKYVQSAAQGDYLHLKCVTNGEWRCVMSVGSWTVEA